MPNSLMNKRLQSYIKFVIRDQIDMCENRKDYKDYVSFLQEALYDKKILGCVLDWVQAHDFVLTDKNDICDRMYYRMIVDGILLEQAEANDDIDVGSLAFEYEKDYSRVMNMLD